MGAEQSHQGAGQGHVFGSAGASPSRACRRCHGRSHCWRRIRRPRPDRSRYPAYTYHILLPLRALRGLRGGNCDRCFDEVFLERRNFQTQVEINKTIEARDGTLVQSVGERRIAEWLTTQGIAYRYDAKHHAHPPAVRNSWQAFT